MKAEDRTFLDSIKGKVSDGAYDFMFAFYSLSPTKQAFLMPYIEQIAKGADVDETITKAENDLHKLRMCKTA